MTPIPPIPEELKRWSPAARLEGRLGGDKPHGYMVGDKEGLWYFASTVDERIAKLIAEVERLQGCLMDWENREAAICPEDVGFEEFIKVLQADSRSGHLLACIRQSKPKLGVSKMQTMVPIETVSLPTEQPNANAEINAAITLRLVEFYNHLVSNGCIEPLPTDGPTCTCV